MHFKLVVHLGDVPVPADLLTVANRKSNQEPGRLDGGRHELKPSHSALRSRPGAVDGARVPRPGHGVAGQCGEQSLGVLWQRRDQGHQRERPLGLDPKRTPKKTPIVARLVC